eukprot:4070009-Amphidinium_carterae.1
MNRASCFLHQPSARSWARLSDKHHQTRIRVRGQLNGFIELSLLTSEPSGSVWPSTWEYHQHIYQRTYFSGSYTMQLGYSTDTKLISMGSHHMSLSGVINIKVT